MIKIYVEGIVISKRAAIIKTEKYVKYIYREDKYTKTNVKT